MASAERIATFEKVSEGISGLSAADVLLPERATAGSAGYDFRAPYGFTVPAGGTVLIPTGIRAKIDEGWVLMLYPRSGLGFRYRLTLDNTVGIIDSDYYYSENEGHIMVKLTVMGDKPLTVAKHEAFCQGVFVRYGITLSDNATAKRNGGFGSTDTVGDGKKQL